MIVYDTLKWRTLPRRWTNKEWFEMSTVRELSCTILQTRFWLCLCFSVPPGDRDGEYQLHCHHRWESRAFEKGVSHKAVQFGTKYISVTFQHSRGTEKTHWALQIHSRVFQSHSSAFWHCVWGWSGLQSTGCPYSLKCLQCAAIFQSLLWSVDLTLRCLFI